MTNEGGDPNREPSPEEPPPAGALPLDDVGRLVSLLSESGVGEIRVRQGELEITVKARTGTPVEFPAETSVSSHTSRSAPQTGGPRAEATADVSGTNGSGERGGDLHVVRSPVVGTFYRAPAPEEEPYVEVGDRVGEGQTLCIVEAMKLMNEIPSDVSGEVVEVLAENAKGVEYDQPLLRLRPEVASLRSGEWGVGSGQ